MIVKDVFKSFGEKCVLSNFSAAFSQNEWTLLTGPSGSGKTTLFRILLGLEKPDAGEILEKPEHFSVVFQENRLCEEMTVKENIWLVTGKAYSEEKTELALNELGIYASKDQKVSELSGGMKRRVAIARAVLLPAEAYLLDEPFYGLDRQNKEAAIKFLVHSLKGRTVILITHDQDAIDYLKTLLLYKEVLL